MSYVNLRVELTGDGPEDMALIQAITPESQPRIAAMRFHRVADFPTSGEYRAAIADSVAQVLDDLL